MAASAPARLALRIGKSPLRFPISIVDRSIRPAKLIVGREALPISAADRIGGFLFSSSAGLGGLYCARTRPPVTGADDDAAEKKDDVDIDDVDFSDGDDFSDSSENDYFDDVDHVDDRFGYDSDE